MLSGKWLNHKTHIYTPTDKTDKTDVTSAITPSIGSSVSGGLNTKIIGHSKLQRGQVVHTRSGRGKIWEIYLDLKRVGIVFDGTEHPVFVGLDEIYDPNTQDGLHKAASEAIDDVAAVSLCVAPGAIVGAPRLPLDHSSNALDQILEWKQWWLTHLAGSGR